ncbi:MAG TPA: hypothetical protein VGC36_15825 [Rhizomicrobium sp.]
MSNVTGRAAYRLWQLASMRRVIAVYVVLDIVVALLTAVRLGFWAGFCAVLAPLLLGIAAGGMKAMFFWGSRRQKIFGIVCALAAGTIAVRLAPEFSVIILDHGFGGPAWSVVAGVLGLLASGRRNWEAVA